MTEVVELFRYATSNGFCVFLGVAVLLSILTNGATSALAFVATSLRNSIK